MPDLFFADLVRETSTATGTGALALGGATPGHRRFADAVPAGRHFHYAVAGVTHEAEWEVGEGVLTPAGLDRLAVLASSADGAPVGFSEGLKTVTLTVAAEWFAERQDRASHAHGIGQIEGLAAALAAKQPAGSYAPAVHFHDYLPRDSAGNWIAYPGRLGVGSHTPFADLEVRGPSIGGYSMEYLGTTNPLPGTQLYLGDGNFHNPDYWNSAPGIGAIMDPSGVCGALGLAAYGGNASSRSLIALATHNGFASRGFTPGADNAVLLGRPGLRWSEIHAVAGPISTSDARDKMWRGGLSDAEYRAGRALLAELGFFQWVESIAAKGEDGARRHFGVRAQRAFAIMEQHGLDWRHYGWCCHDSWEEDDGPRERYGIRSDQLCLFLLAVLAHRIDGLADEASDAAG